MVAPKEFDALNPSIIDAGLQGAVLAQLLTQTVVNDVRLPGIDIGEVGAPQLCVVGAALSKLFLQVCDLDVAPIFYCCCPASKRYAWCASGLPNELWHRLALPYRRNCVQ